MAVRNLKAFFSFILLAILAMAVYLLVINNSENRIKRVISNNSDAMVMLKAYGNDDKEIGTASGFIYNNNIVTNYHVVEDARFLKAVFSDSSSTYIQGINNFNAKLDIAVLPLDNPNIKGVKIGNSGKVKDGDTIIAIGSPSALQNTVSTGIISSKSRNMDGTDIIQITAPISPGSSGGALFNMKGQVVGITSSGLEQGDIGFAVPIGYVIPLLEEKNYKSFATRWKENAIELKKNIENFKGFDKVEVQDFPGAWYFVYLHENVPEYIISKEYFSIEKNRR